MTATGLVIREFILFTISNGADPLLTALGARPSFGGTLYRSQYVQPDPRSCLPSPTTNAGHHRAHRGDACCTNRRCRRHAAPARASARRRRASRPGANILFQPSGGFFEATVDSAGLVSSGAVGTVPVVISAFVPGGKPVIERVDGSYGAGSGGAHRRRAECAADARRTAPAARRVGLLARRRSSRRSHRVDVVRADHRPRDGRHHRSARGWKGDDHRARRCGHASDQRRSRPRRHRLRRSHAGHVAGSHGRRREVQSAS